MRRQFGKWLICMSVLCGCGTNVLQSQESEDVAEDATIALENEDPDYAIELLENALEDEPTHAQYLSILSLAYAQRAGVEPISFALNLTQQGSADDGEAKTQYEVMFDLLPSPTADNLNDINEAVSLLASIPFEDRLPGDAFKLAMFQTAAFVMQTKRFDADLDGSLTALEVADLTAEDAAVMLNQLDQVAVLLSQDEDDPTSQAAAEKITGFQEELDAQPGETDEEKLKNYLAGSSNT